MKSSKEILKDYTDKMLQLGQFTMTVMEAQENAEKIKTHLANLQIDYKKAVESEAKQAAVRQEVKDDKVAEVPVV